MTPPKGTGQVDLPNHYKGILTDVAAELDSRYNFAHPNHKLQIIKRNDALNIFKYTHNLDLGL